ncbi:hypothetical protein OGAPHI_001556 [Ogataea philodendri]|uniref:Uncharacterized protein n=1 Tax=Ogataea philodendri TaxID=1378263 RepID=A0A9P8PD07_9ASCO|nr:uncharacterized protein OGAPHI_001556 [Ogataea philodendri]KAH3669435.1 hypothetical protein OGAPHI_001556 [Ogataea philodendri]
MRTTYWLLSLVLLWVSVLADVNPTAPSDGDVYTVSGSSVSFEVGFDDDGTSPDISTALSFTITLVTGPNTDITARSTLAESISLSDLTDNKYKVTVDADVGASGSYYIQIYASFGSSSYTIHYTPRFQLKGMTGSLAASGSGDPPAAQTAGVSESVDSKSFTVPYTLQTGKTRYAPMQLQPGSTITATSWSRRFPTSAVTYFTTIAGTPSVYSTKTPGWSYTMSSLVNYATPAPFPSEVSCVNKLVNRGVEDLGHLVAQLHEFCHRSLADLAAKVDDLDHLDSVVGVDNSNGFVPVVEQHRLEQGLLVLESQLHRPVGLNNGRALVGRLVHQFANHTDGLVGELGDVAGVDSD